jgi:sugar O-acyltransferase (sialic acid O-acetyltransferase NeuD family)
MKNLIIIGARGFGREVYHLVMDMILAGHQLRVKGFLDDQSDALAGTKGYPPILGSVEAYMPQSDDVFTCALGDVAGKEKYVKIILEKNGKFVNLIHPTAIVRNIEQIGEGCIIQAFANVSAEVRIGSFVSIQAHTIVGHDAVIGDWCHLSPFVFLGGNAVLEERVTAFPRATVMPGVGIRQGARIGIGSVVMKHVEPGITVFGNPARPIS